VGALNNDPEMKELAAKSGFELVNVGVEQMDAFMKDCCWNPPSLAELPRRSAAGHNRRPGACPFPAQHRSWNILPGCHHAAEGPDPCSGRGQGGWLDGAGGRSPVASRCAAEGLVVTRYHHIPPRPVGLPQRIELVEASHPVPDAAGLAGRASASWR
jgi:hypothetical protein